MKSTASKPTWRHSKTPIDIADSDDEDLLAAAQRYELLRSWVDAGIEIAIREIEEEQRYALNYSKRPIANLIPAARDMCLGPATFLASQARHWSHTTPINFLSPRQILQIHKAATLME